MRRRGPEKEADNLHFACPQAYTAGRRFQRHAPHHGGLVSAPHCVPGAGSPTALGPAAYIDATDHLHPRHFTDHCDFTTFHMGKIREVFCSSVPSALRGAPLFVPTFAIPVDTLLADFAAKQPFPSFSPPSTCAAATGCGGTSISMAAASYTTSARSTAFSSVPAPAPSAATGRGVTSSSTAAAPHYHDYKTFSDFYFFGSGTKFHPG